MKLSRTILFTIAIASVNSLQAGWTRLPHTESRPIDLSVVSIPGTEVLSSSGIGNAAALVSYDISDIASIPAGKSSAVIQLNSQQNVHTVSFNNYGVEGKITVAGSGDNKDWVGLGTAEFTAEDGLAQLHFASATLKYLSITFEATKGGAIRAFETYGASTNRDYDLVPKGAGEGGASTVNLASGIGGAKAIYAFPTPTNVGELNDLQNVFKFPKSKDKFRTIVYDLGGVRTMKHFATSYSQRLPVRVEVFAFDELPEKKDWRGKLTLDPAFLTSLKPVAVGEDPKGVGHIKITPSKPVSAQYVALRFEPNYQRNAAAGIFDIGAQELIVATAGPLGAVLDELGFVPEFRFTQGQAGEDGQFVVYRVYFASAGAHVFDPKGKSDGDRKNKGNESAENNNNTVGGVVPYTQGPLPARGGGGSDGNGIGNNNNGLGPGNGPGPGRGPGGGGGSEASPPHHRRHHHPPASNP